MSLSTRAALQQLKQQLERRGQLIQRAAALLKISFGEVNDHYFSVHMWWRGGELIKRITWDEHFKMGSHGPTLVWRPCELSRRLIRLVFEQRGL